MARSAAVQARLDGAVAAIDRELAANLELTSMFDQTNQPFVLENGQWQLHGGAIEKELPGAHAFVAELYARMRQLDWRTATFGTDEILKIDDLVVDIAGYEARLAGRRIELTHQEFELLRFLGQHRGRVFTREALLERAWGYRYAGGTRTVDIHVRRVRAKLGEAGSIIETVRNVGYKMRG